MSAPSRISKFQVTAVDLAGNLAEFCRLAAKDLSDTLKPKLDEKNIRLIGVGFDEKFLKPFVEGKFFSGELYIDTEKKCYNELQFRRVGFCEGIRGLFNRKWRQVAANASSKGIQGDMKGDGFQNGGALVIDKKGKLLLEYVQVDASDHVEANSVLNALGIN